MFSRREERKATDRERLIRVGQQWAGIVHNSNAHFSLAASSSSGEHIKNVRLAGMSIMAARAAGNWLVDELQRQGMSAVAGYVSYLDAVARHSIVAYYEGPGVDPELDRRLGIIIENVRRIDEALSWDLWTAGDRTRIQSAIDGLELLPLR
ncbi:MAG: hypothetical protein KGZ92_05835 [Firmicutes bacterium]|nr:hypothetical protein [Dethiobacter sp.]MBS3888808.1 hypothetical protein [Bacillota bacterium]MBS4055591.1 hypothetical protein [Thermaerobacter sp.]